MNTQEERKVSMNQVVPILNGLPLDGLRLDSGLALRLTSGNGMAVLGCSRLKTAPSDEEMALVQEAVWQVFTPEILLQATTISLTSNQDGEHHIRRLYWPLERVAVVRTQVVQASLLDLE
jgi:hypothetical protein